MLLCSPALSTRSFCLCLLRAGAAGRHEHAWHLFLRVALACCTQSRKLSFPTCHTLGQVRAQQGKGLATKPDTWPEFNSQDHMVEEKGVTCVTPQLRITPCFLFTTPRIPKTWLVRWIKCYHTHQASRGRCYESHWFYISTFLPMHI